MKIDVLLELTVLPRTLDDSDNLAVTLSYRVQQELDEKGPLEKSMMTCLSMTALKTTCFILVAYGVGAHREVNNRSLSFVVRHTGLTRSSTSTYPKDQQ